MAQLNADDLKKKKRKITLTKMQLEDLTDKFEDGYAALMGLNNQVDARFAEIKKFYHQTRGHGFSAFKDCKQFKGVTDDEMKAIEDNEMKEFYKKADKYKFVYQAYEHVHEALEKVRKMEEEEEKAEKMDEENPAKKPK